MKKIYSIYLPEELINRLDKGQDFIPRSKLIELVLRNFLDSKETIPALLKKVRLVQTNV